MEDIFYVVLGVFAIYTWVHFYVFSFTKPWNQRNSWEQIVTILSAVFFGLVLSNFF